MSLLGMGPMEILLILLLGFILLGPARLVDAARQVGKATREIRRMADELPRIDLADSVVQTYARPIVPSGGGPHPRESKPVSQDRQDEGVATEDAGDEGPVQLQASRAGGEPEDDGPQQKDLGEIS